MGEEREGGERARSENTEGGGRREGLGPTEQGGREEEEGRMKRKSPSSNLSRSCAIHLGWDWPLNVRDTPPPALVTNSG